MLMVMPYQLVVSVALISVQIGASFLTALVIIILSFIWAMVLVRFRNKIQRLYMAKQDERINTTSECLSNVKMVKLYAWNQSFEEVIEKKREVELSYQFKNFRLSSVNIFGMFFYPMLMVEASLATYIASGHTITLSEVFQLYGLYELMFVPFRFLPMLISLLMDNFIALRRIQEFIFCPEVNRSLIYHNDPNNQEEDAIRVRSNSNFHWGVKPKETEEEKKRRLAAEKKAIKNGGKPITVEEVDKEEHETPKKTSEIMTLKNMNLSIKKGSFVCIIGEVGSGKSSLLSAMIGDMLYLNSGQVVTVQPDEINEQSFKQLPSGRAPIVVNQPLSYA